MTRIVVTSILSSVYGWPDIELESPFPQFFQALLDHVSSACLPGTYLVDTLPFLNYLPAWMAPWKREGLAWHDRHSQILEEFNAGVRKKMVWGVLSPYVCCKRRHANKADCIGNGRCR